MEEVKINNAETEKREEPTVEQLKNWCNQLMMQRNQLAEKLNQITDSFNTLPWLFKVVENKENFNKKFVEMCVEAIMFIMSSTEPKESNKEQDTKSNKD